MISRKRLAEFSLEHPDAGVALDVWYRIAKSSRWTSLMEVRQVYPHADSVAQWTVFNIRGNRYRLITEIDYQTGIILIRRVLTHSEYDRGGWKR